MLIFICKQDCINYFKISKQEPIKLKIIVDQLKRQYGHQIAKLSVIDVLESKTHSVLK